MRFYLFLFVSENFVSACVRACVHGTGREREIEGEGVRRLSTPWKAPSLSFTSSGFNGPIKNKCGDSVTC